jgi:sulfur relay (sulfurtransferase) DsrC/TusE family protein
LLSRQIYDSVIPQLDHLTLTRLHETDFEHLLGLSTSLQSLDIGIFDVGTSGVFSKVLDHLARIDVKELHYSHNIWFNKMDNWEKDFESMAELKKVVEGKDHLELVKFHFVFGYHWKATTGVSARSLVNWKGIKAELESICVERGIEVAGLNCYLNCGDAEYWGD